VLFVMIAGTNIPSPLYKEYARLWHFSPTTLTLLFSTYAAVLVIALLLASRVVTRFGYRSSLTASILVAAAASAVFAIAPDTLWLFIARGLQGAAVGIASGAFTAAIVALHPRSDARAASVTVSAMTAFGGGLGPIACGILAEYLPYPLHTIFWVEAVLLIVGAATVLSIPGHLGRAASTASPWPALPADRRTFLTAAAATFLAWGVVALFLTIAPSLITDLTGNTHVIIAGLVAGIVLVASGIAQLGLSRIATATAHLAGLALLAVGLLGLIASTLITEPVIVLAAAVIAGTGHGLAFMAALRQTNALTEGADNRPGVLSSFYIATYGGVGVPIIGVGLLATASNTTTAVRAFAVVVIAALLLLAVASRFRPSAPSATHADRELLKSPR